MTINNQDKTEIHELPEVLTLQAGMMVAVDSEPTGTKSFNLTAALEGKAESSDVSDLETTVAGKANESDLTALATTVSGKADASTVNQLSTVVEGKLDSPATSPAEGQVLTFNGSANTWANPPEGVYVLNYSEVNNLTDIDLNRAKTQPTYIRVDEEYGDVTISVPYNNGGSFIDHNDIILKVGTILKLSNIKANDAEFIFTTIYHDVFNGGGTLGSNGTFFPVLYLRSDNGYIYKYWKVTGEMNLSGINMGMPVPFTKFYRSTRGNGSAASAGNSMEVQFQWDGNIRKQCLLPGEIIDHDFASDATPEQIQFMGWGATSNRAGYKTTLKSHDVPDSTTYPDQTPEVSFTRILGSMTETAATADANQFYTQVSAKVKSADGASNIYYSGMLAPTRLPNSRIGYLTCWGDSKGSHFGWRPPIENIGALTDAATISTNRLNNSFATLSTSQSALTIVAQVDADEVINFCLEITPSVNCTLTVKKQIGQSTTIITLKHSVSAGNTLEANKTYQVTAVGTCWTLAEFQSPS